MIITGGYSTRVLTQQAPELTCRSCGHVGTTDFHVFSKCLHMFLIPLLALGKIGHSSCRSCGSQFREDEMPADMSPSFLAAKSAARAPLWQYSGVAVLGVLYLSLSVVNAIGGTRDDEPVPMSVDAVGVVEYVDNDEYGVKDYEDLKYEDQNQDDEEYEFRKPEFPE